jgi:hypothetical protein
MNTAEKLAEMLTENTGIAMMDSGFAYGRNWQHNQGKTLDNFMAAPYATLDPHFLDYTVDVFHYLDDKLEYDEEADKIFQDFLNSDEHKKEDYSEAAHAFADQFPNIYGSKESFWENSYNGECNLSQTILVCSFYSGDTDILPLNSYIILQIHGGADVRGGYTKPVLFIGDEDIFSWASGNLRCDRIIVPKGQLNINGDEEYERHHSFFSF